MKKKYIDPDLADKILTRLNSSCLSATKQVGNNMGFSIEENSFVIEHSPERLERIIFSFNVTLTPE